MHPLLGLLPVLAVIVTTAVGLVLDGRATALASGVEAPGLREILSQANSFEVLM